MQDVGVLVAPATQLPIPTIAAATPATRSDALVALQLRAPTAEAGVPEVVPSNLSGDDKSCINDP